MAHSKIMMRILLSSPTDVKNEREIVSIIVDEINAANKETPYGIELYRWEKDTDPEIINASGQKLIDQTFDYKHSDLMIAIFYRRSGKWTEYEIDKAISVQKKYGFPQIKLYFKKPKELNVDEDRIKSIQRILALENKYKSKGITGELKGTRKAIESELRKHIQRAFDNFVKIYARANVYIPEVDRVRINPYKLFYYRVAIKKYSEEELATKTRIPVARIKKFEAINNRQSNNIVYSECKYKELRKLEEALGTHAGELCVGRIEEEFEKCYGYYKSNRQLTNKNFKQFKAVVFDFDGTLVDPHSLKTTWKCLWTSLGYDTAICDDLHSKFDRKEITHQEWCDETAEYFIKRTMTRENLHDVANTIVKMDGLHETLEILHGQGIKLYILSGSIKELIYLVLGEDANYFEDISANEFVFDEKDRLTAIKGTDYDFDGKAAYVSNLSKKLNISTSSIRFIGNSFNDAHVYKSGARTLCVNPTLTNSHNKTYWHESIDDMKNLSEIIRYCIPDMENIASSNHSKSVDENNTMS